MKILILVALVACTSAIQLAPLTLEDSHTRVPGEYIVIFETNITDDQVANHTHAVRNLMLRHGNETNQILGEYHIGTFRGYGAKMDDKLRDLVRSMSHVEFVECNQVVSVTQRCIFQKDATWGISRITCRNRPNVWNYFYNENAGEGVDVYILDTGIYTQHPDFGGRAKWGADFVDKPSPRTDLNGHGTHVAGTVMSNTWGVAKKATGIAVRVLDQNGDGPLDGIISGINYVAQQHLPGKKSVANMSLRGGKSESENRAVAAAVRKGVHFAVGAGNDAMDACIFSPASSPVAVTVGASNMENRFAWFSNYGRCVDIIAPGVDIISTSYRGGYTTDSGTSMASPHVAGMMAMFLSGSTSYTPAQLANRLKRLATRNTIMGNLKGTPNLLTFLPCP